MIILTSNIGTHAFAESARIGFDRNADHANTERHFDNIRATVLKELKQTIRPELLSRLGETLVFRPLDRSAIEAITKQELEKLKHRLKKKGVTITYPKTILSFIGETGFVPAEGARPIRKKIELGIEQPIAEFLLTHPKKKKLSLVLKNKQILVR
jgi:ATP-dependent Clp protease ATP-binding subunit ClpC